MSSDGEGVDRATKCSITVGRQWVVEENEERELTSSGAGTEKEESELTSSGNNAAAAHIEVTENTNLSLFVPQLVFNPFINENVPSKTHDTSSTTNHNPIADAKLFVELEPPDLLSLLFEKGCRVGNDWQEPIVAELFEKCSSRDLVFRDPIDGYATFEQVFSFQNDLVFKLVLLLLDDMSM
ncbi:hypothetical protein Syun_006984 [Stephania yunnanensis]|uniref:Uncharacterized protein n=1 Tax=Stephania yunnanensis TaxID=152371 RepID=A0AAP0PY66_9MAGN